MSRFKKGSAAAKRYMAKIRGMKKGSHVSRSSRKAGHHSHKGGKTRKMARRRWRRHSSRRSRKIPLAPVGGVVYGLTQGWGGGSVVSDIILGRYENALKQLATGFGFNAFTGKIDLGSAKILHGLLAGGLIHIVASKLGVNRAIQKVPLVNI